MNDLITRLALEAGFVLHGDAWSRDGACGLTTDALERFAALVAEECTKVCTDRAQKIEIGCSGDRDDDAFRHGVAWQLSVCTNIIRTKFGSKG